MEEFQIRNDNEILCNKMITNSKKHHYLYHYTSYQTLIKILKNNSFMFNRTDFVNDLIERERIVKGSTESFVSCYTHNKKESIPMWLLYAKKDGVRIGFKNKLIFDNQRVYYYKNDQKIYFEKKAISSNKIPSNIIKVYNGYIEASNPFRIDIIYSNDKLKNQFCFEDQGIQEQYPYIQVGIKSNPWEYEKETRYFIGTSIFERLNIEKLYCEFSDFFYNGLEIVWNPIMKNKNEKIQEIKTILGKSNTNIISFKDSELQDKISQSFIE